MRVQEERKNEWIKNQLTTTEERKKKTYESTGAMAGKYT
jgi:hypothetical protein